MDKKKLIFTALITISILGIFLSGMLTAAEYSDNIALLCGQDVDSSCNVVQNSQYSKLIDLENTQNGSNFEIPVSLLGIIFYILVLGLSIFMFKQYKNKNKIDIKYKYMMLVLCVIGVSFSIVFVLIQAFLIEAFCTYCMISALDTLFLLFLALALFFI